MISRYTLTRKVLALVIFIIFAISLIGTAISIAIAEVSVSEIADADSVLISNLKQALKATEQLRQHDRSTVVDCTKLFESFKSYQQTGPYVSFFKKMEVPAIADDRNNRHYIGFQLNHLQLRSMGFDKFFPDDRLVIVFTTASAVSDEITSFEVTLLNTRHL